MKGRERMGSSLPPNELARWDSALFEKMKCIFSIAPVGNFGEVAGVFLVGRWPRKHWTLSLRIWCAMVLDLARVKHRKMSTGHRVTRVRASGAI